MAEVALGKLGVDEVGAGAGYHLFVEARLEAAEDLFVAPHEAGLEEGGANGVVLAGEADAFLHRARGVADLEPQVPQHVEHVFHQLLAVGRLLVGQQKHQVDVGMGRHLLAAVAAGGGHRHLLALGRIGRRVHVAQGEVVNGANQLVDQMGAGADGLGAGGAFVLEAAAHLGAAAGQGVLENLEDPPLGLRRIAGPLGEVVERPGQRLAVDDVARFMDAGHGLPRTCGA